MEPKFQTSFIPKEALTAATTGRRPRGTASLITVAAVVLFLGSLVAALGIFLYGLFLERSIESKNASLARAKEEFEPALITELTRLDGRINAAQEILQKHVAVSEIFSLLSSYTLESVRFDNFNYQNDSAGKITLSMKGQAKSFGSLANQSDVFAKVPFLKNQIFGSPNLDAAGKVLFDFSATVDPALVSYPAALQTP